MGAIAAERGDVVADPFDGETLVEEADVLGQAGCAREAEDIDAVVDGDDENILSVGEILAVVEWSVCSAKVEFWEGELAADISSERPSARTHCRHRRKPGLVAGGHFHFWPKYSGSDSLHSVAIHWQC